MRNCYLIGSISNENVGPTLRATTSAPGSNGDWIKKEKKLDADIAVQDWELPAEDRGLFGLGLHITSGALKALGLPDLAQQAQIQKLDGLVSVWHPSLQ